MSDAGWDGNGLLVALTRSAATLEAAVDEVNALNVFPVPDGDTGSNMLATVQAAVGEAEAVPMGERSVARVGAALGQGALMGARGNSGVILSQLFRGIGEAVNGVDTINGSELADALRQGCQAAFSAVAQPVEGTILSVARDVSVAAAAALVNNGSLEHVLAAAATEAAASVARTPSQLAVLRNAGVVDAGGKGFELLLQGALASLRGGHGPIVAQSGSGHDIPMPIFNALEAQGFGYETVFMVMPRAGEWLRLDEIRARLAAMGESVLVAGDRNAIKVHVHNEQPDAVVAYGLTLGSLSRISIENLDRQASVVRQRANEQHDDGEGVATGVPPVATQLAPNVLAVVAVAPGAGWRRLFATLGVTAIVDGGQGANPSAGELVEAVRSTGAARAILLPNNLNARLAARQAGALSAEQEIEIVPSRNPAEGVAALLALQPDLELKALAKVMSAAAQKVQTLQVTRAVRDARMDRRHIHRGEFIVLGPGDGVIAVDPDRTAAVLAAVRSLKPGFELLTVYCGRAVDERGGAALRDALTAALGGVEIELVDGGQPYYDFLIAAE